MEKRPSGKLILFILRMFGRLVPDGGFAGTAGAAPLVDAFAPPLFREPLDGVGVSSSSSSSSSSVDEGVLDEVAVAAGVAGGVAGGVAAGSAPKHCLVLQVATSTHTNAKRQLKALANFVESSSFILFISPNPIVHISGHYSQLESLFGLNLLIAIHIVFYIANVFA